MTAVIDSSALVAFSLKEKGLNVEAMKDLFLEEVISIDLIRAESTNAILVSKQRGIVGSEDASAALRVTLKLLENNFKFMDQNDELILDSYNLADSQKLSVYDAIYVSLAKREDCSLASKDAKQIEVARKLGIRIEEI
ncbi:MAG: type II toxin-antitoxin system VapC family toxin [Nitrososphaerales archaeon]